MKLLVHAGGRRAKWQTGAQFLYTIGSTSAEFSKTDRMALKTGDDLSARVRFERDMRCKPSRKNYGPGSSHSLCSGSPQITLRSGGEAG
jgi:hypothetical protein